MTGYRLTELDEDELRWFWLAAEGDLGFRSTAGSDMERASQQPLRDSRPCDMCAGRWQLLPEPERRALGRGAGAYRRWLTATCPECHGLGVVVDTVKPRPSLGGGMPREAPYQAEGASMPVHRFEGRRVVRRVVGPRASHRYVRGVLVAIDPRHVSVLHTVYGPAPMDWQLEDALTKAPAGLLALALLNQAVNRARLERALGAKRTVQLRRTVGLGAQRHADMLLSASSSAYDRARRGTVDEDREQAVDDLEAMREALRGAA